MRLTYRQGLVGAPSGYLQINGSSVNLVISQVPVLATAAFEYANYLIGEYASVTGAWTVSGSGPNYLYWQINQATGAVERGSTLLLPVQQATAPTNPSVGQLWWNTTNTTMNIWTGVVWETIILVFAGVVTGSVVSYYNNAAPGFSQVGLNGLSPPINAGYVLTDNYGGVFRDQNGYLLTTETQLISQDTGSQVKLDGALVVVTSYNLPIPAFTLVYLNNGFATPASSDPTNYQTQAPIAMVTEATPPNSAVALVQAGRMVINTAWSFTPSQFGSPVYVSSDGYGTLTTTKPVTAKYVRVGTIVGNNSVFLSFDWETDLPSATIVSGVSEVLSTSPVTISGSGGYPVIGVQPVSTTQPGYLDASDYSTFLGYATNKISTVTATVGDIATWTTGGQLVDSGISASSLVTSVNLSSKADKVTGATANNFAGLNSSGNLIDSGYNAGNFATISTIWPQSQVTGLSLFITTTNAALSARINTVPSATTGDIATWTTGGQLVDSGTNISAIASKMDMVPGAVLGNFPAFTSTGDVSDSGYNSNSFAPATSTAAAITSLNTSVSTINSTLSTKADKVTANLVANDFAALNASGDLIDSGYSPSYFAGATATTNALNVLTGNVTSLTTSLGNKVDKPTVTTSGDFASLLSNGDIADSGFNSGSFIAYNSTTIAQSQIVGLITSLSSKVNRSGDTMTGLLNVPSFAVGSVFSVQSTGEIDLSNTPGTAGQVLTSNGAGAAATWTTISTSGGTSAAVTLTQVSNNQNYYLTFAAAQAGNQALYATGASPSYYNPGTNTLTVGTVVAAGGFQGNATSATNATTAANIAGGVAGSIAYQTTANTTSQLAIGTAGQVLTVAGGVPTWAAPTASISAPLGQLVYGTGSSVTSSSALTFTASSSTLYAPNIQSNLSTSTSTITITPDINGYGPLLNGEMNGYSDGKVSGGPPNYSTGSTAGSVTSTQYVNGAKLQALVFEAAGGQYKVELIVYGNQPQNLFTSFSFTDTTPAVETFTSASATYAVITGTNGTFTYWQWNAIEHYPFGTGSPQSITFTITGATLPLTLSGTSIDLVTAGSLVVNGASGTAGQVLTSAGSGSPPVWSSATGGGTPAGSTGEIQFNNSGAFGASPDLVWNATTDTLVLGQTAFNAEITANLNPLFYYLPGVISGNIPVSTTLTQATTGATALVQSVGSGFLDVYPVTGTPNATSVWSEPSTGGTGGPFTITAAQSANPSGIGAGDYYVGYYGSTAGLPGLEGYNQGLLGSLTGNGVIDGYPVRAVVAGYFGTNNVIDIWLEGAAGTATFILQFTDNSGNVTTLNSQTGGFGGFPAFVEVYQDSNGVNVTQFEFNVSDGSTIISAPNSYTFTIAGTTPATLTPTAVPALSNGTITASLGSSPVTGEEYLITFTSSTTYTVFDFSTSSYLAAGTVGTQYTTPTAVWTINAGSVPFQVGDSGIVALTNLEVPAQITDTSTGTTITDISSGFSIIGQASGQAGSCTVSGGYGVQAGGNLNLLGGPAEGFGGQITVQGGESNNGDGGAANIAGGQGNGLYGNGGNLFLQGGNATGVSASAGNVTIGAGINYGQPGNQQGSIIFTTAATGSYSYGYQATRFTIDPWGTFILGTSPGNPGEVITSNGPEAPPYWSSPSAGPNLTVQTTAYTASANDRIIADTTTGAFTVSLPASPTQGQEVFFLDGGGTWGTNNLTVATTDGSNIMGLASPMIVNQSNDNFSLIYYNTTRGWILGD